MRRPQHRSTYAPPGVAMTPDTELVSLLNPEKALIFRITHIDNVPWILDHGLHCTNADVRDPNFREIGNPDLIAKRAHRQISMPPGGTLADYVPFYFTPYTPMLYNIKTGYQGMTMTPIPEIVILFSSVHALVERGLPFLLTDRHAYLATAQYSNDRASLERIDWQILQARDFRRSDDNLGRIERYQAEALVHRHLPLDALAGLVCHGAEQQAQLDVELSRRGASLNLVVRPEWYL